MKHRLKAASLHLLCSLLIIGGLVSLFVWYFFPGPFFHADDIGTGIRILAGVDMVLGPLLTFLIYRPGKKGLALDLAIIALCQALALGWGLASMHSSRPAYLVFYGDTFYLADIRRIDQSSLVHDELKVGYFDRPKLVSAHLPGNRQERLALTLEYISNGTPVQFHAAFFEAFSNTPADTLKQHQLKPDLLIQDASQQLASQLHAFQNGPYAFFYLTSHIGERLAVVDIEKRTIVAVLKPR